MKDGSRAHRLHYAQFAMAGYGKDLDKIPQGYAMDLALSNRNRRVFVNPDAKHVVVAHRGTVPGFDSQGIADLSTDAALAIGQQHMTPRFRNALKHARAVEKAYGADFRYTATGHSLGSSVATHVGDRNATWDVVGFAGHHPTTKIANEFLFSALGMKPKNKRAVHYSAALDPIGTGMIAAKSPYRKSYYVRQKVYDPHALANFMR